MDAAPNSLRMGALSVVPEVSRVGAMSAAPESLQLRVEAKSAVQVISRVGATRDAPEEEPVHMVHVQWNGQRDCLRTPALSQVVEKQVECTSTEDAGDVHQCMHWDSQGAPDDYNAG